MYGLEQLYISYFSPEVWELYERQNATISQDTSFNFSETQYAHESSLYVEDDVKINDQLKVNIGLRYNTFHFDNGADLNDFFREEYFYLFFKVNTTLRHIEFLNQDFRYAI